jgi:hypothetical protein
MFTFFAAYYLACESQCTGSLQHDAAGWCYNAKHGRHPRTEEQAFHGMWRDAKAASVLYLAIAFGTVYVFVGSCLRTWRQSRIQQLARPTGDILGDAAAPMIGSGE